MDIQNFWDTSHRLQLPLEGWQICSQHPSNSNVGAQILSPIATEIEKQSIRWLAEFIGVSTAYGGIFVSGGNMANFTAFLAARTAKAPKSIKTNGISNESDKLTVYCSKATHTWIEKAMILFGLGTKSLRWIGYIALHIKWM